MNTDAIPAPAPSPHRPRTVMAAEAVLVLLALLFLWPLGVMLSTSVRNDAHRASHRSEWLPRAEYVQRPGGHWREVLKAEDLAAEGKPGLVRAQIGDWSGRIDKTVIVRADEIHTHLGPTLRPYFRGLFADGFALRAAVTLALCAVAVLAATFTSALAAYAFSILCWPGRDAVFYLVLGSLTVPMALTMVPVAGLYKAVGGAAVHAPLFLPAFFGNAFFIFLLRRAFLKVSSDLVDAARLEGGTEWQVFTGVVLPAARPALATVAVLAFVWQWSQAVGPVFSTPGSDNPAFLEGLVHLRANFPKLRGEQMAMCAVSIAPVALVVFLARRAWVRGLRAFLPASLS